MTNLEKYVNSFVETFEVNPEDVYQLTAQETEAWDSVGHLSLISSLEDTFDIEFEPEDILAVTSFQTGIDVLKTKGIEI